MDISSILMIVKFSIGIGIITATVGYKLGFRMGELNEKLRNRHKNNRRTLRK